MPPLFEHPFTFSNLHNVYHLIIPLTSLLALQPLLSLSLSRSCDHSPPPLISNSSEQFTTERYEFNVGPRLIPNQRKRSLFYLLQTLYAHGTFLVESTTARYFLPVKLLRDNLGVIRKYRFFDACLKKSCTFYFISVWDRKWFTNHVAKFTIATFFSVSLLARAQICLTRVLGVKKKNIEMRYFLLQRSPDFVFHFLIRLVLDGFHYYIGFHNKAHRSGTKSMYGNLCDVCLSKSWC